MAISGRPSEDVVELLEYAADALLESMLDDEALEARLIDNPDQSRTRPAKWTNRTLDGGMVVDAMLLPRRHAVEICLRDKTYTASLIAAYSPDDGAFERAALTSFRGNEDDAALGAEEVLDTLLGEGWDEQEDESLTSATDEEILAVEEAVKLIRKEMRRGKMRPEVLADLMDELIAMPGVIWAMVDGYAGAMAEPKPNPTALSAWRMLFIAQLRHLRDHLEAKTDGAEEMLANLVDRIAEIGGTEGYAPENLMALTTCLHEARIALPDEARMILAGATADDAAPPDQDTLRAEFAELLDQIVASQTDPFAIAEGLANILATVPDQAQRALAEQFAESHHGPIREMLPLLLLAEHPAMRDAAAEALERIATPPTMTPVMLRRMATARNWVPAREQGPIDRAIERATDAGVVPAAWPDPKPCSTLVSLIDATGVGMVVMTYPPAKPRALLALAIRQGVGIEDAQIGTDMRQADIKDMVRETRRELAGVEVTHAWLDVVVPHLIGTATAQGATPPPNLLFVAEEMGGQGWQARRLDIAAEAQRLAAEAPDAAQLLADSALLMKLPMAVNWYLDDVAVDNALAADETADREAVVLRAVLEPIRAEWAERLVLLALRGAHSPDMVERQRAIELATVATAFAGGTPLGEIGLATELARRSMPQDDRSRIH